MDELGFWRLLEEVPPHDRREGRLVDVLSASLARLPIPRIVDFHKMLMGKCDELLTWPLWEAADVIFQSSCSEDSFCYFRLWIVAQGKGLFQAASTDPDALAEHPHIVAIAKRPKAAWRNEDFPFMQDLLYTSEKAFDLVLLKLRPDLASAVEFPADLNRRPRESPDATMPSDFGNGDRVRRHYPRLVALFSWPLDVEGSR